MTGGYDACALRPSGVGMRCRMRAAAMRRQDTLTSTCSNAQKCTNKRVLSGKEWGKPNKPSVMKGLFHSHLYNDFLALPQVCLTEVLPSSKRLILDIQKCDKPNQKPGTIPNMFFLPRFARIGTYPQYPQYRIPNSEPQYWGWCVEIRYHIPQLYARFQFEIWD